MIDYWLRIGLVILVGYVLGAIPVAYLIARIKHINIFEVGSGNMGATNTSRALGFKWGILVWVLDMFKGVAAIYIGREIMHDSMALATALAAIACIVGH